MRAENPEAPSPGVRVGPICGVGSRCAHDRAPVGGRRPDRGREGGRANGTCGSIRRTSCDCGPEAACRVNDRVCTPEPGCPGERRGHRRRHPGALSDHEHAQRVRRRQPAGCAPRRPGSRLRDERRRQPSTAAVRQSRRRPHPRRTHAATRDGHRRLPQRVHGSRQPASARGPGGRWRLDRVVAAHRVRSRGNRIAVDARWPCAPGRHVARWCVSAALRRSTRASAGADGPGRIAQRLHASRCGRRHQRPPSWRRAAWTIRTGIVDRRRKTELPRVADGPARIPESGVRVLRWPREAGLRRADRSTGLCDRDSRDVEC